MLASNFNAYRKLLQLLPTNVKDYLSCITDKNIKYKIEYSVQLVEYLVVFGDNGDPIVLIYFTITFGVTTLYTMNVVIC